MYIKVSTAHRNERNKCQQKVTNQCPQQVTNLYQLENINNGNTITIWLFERHGLHVRILHQLDMDKNFNGAAIPVSTEIS